MKPIVFGLLIAAVVLACIEAALRTQIPAGIYDRFSTTRAVRLRELRPGFDQLLPTQGGAVPPEWVEGFEWKDYRLRTDADGFIQPSRIHQAAEISVLFLGGSTTECAFLDEEVRFPFLAGRRLEQLTGKRVNAFNAGVAGNNTAHALVLLLGKGVPLRPDYAVLMETINDLVVLADYWSQDPHKSMVIDSKRDSAATISYQFAGLIFPGTLHALGSQARPPAATPTTGRPPINVDQVVAAYSANLRAFVRVSRAYGIEPVLMTQHNRITDQPSKTVTASVEGFLATHDMSYAAFKVLYERMNEAVRIAAKEERALLIDLDAKIPKTAENMVDLVHLNAQGSRKVAEAVATSLATSRARP